MASNKLKNLGVPLPPFDGDYWIRRASHQKNFGLDIVQPTGRIFDDHYLEVVATTPEKNFVTLRARPVMAFGNVSLPSASWLAANSNEISFVVAYVGGLRNNPIIVGYIPKSLSSYADQYNGGKSHKFGSERGELKIDDEQDSVSLHNVESKMGYHQKEGKNYLGVLDSEDYQPQVLGDTAVELLEDLLSALENVTIATSMGPQKFINLAEFTKIKSRVKDIKSSKNFVE